MHPARVGFYVGFLVTLAINALMLAVLREDCDSNGFWTLMNLVGLPCGFAVVIVAPSEFGALVVTSLVSCALWGAAGAGIATLIARRGKKRNLHDERG